MAGGFEASFDWASKSKLNGRLVDGRYHGIAVGAYVEGGASGPREGARLVLEANQIEAPEFLLMLDGRRLAGAGTLRLGAKPALGLGVSADRLELDGGALGLCQAK